MAYVYLVAIELESLRCIAVRLKDLRAKLPADSPMHSAVFQALSLCGEVQASIAANARPNPNLCGDPKCPCQDIYASRESPGS